MPPSLLSRYDGSLNLLMAAQFSGVAVNRLQLKCVPLEDIFRTKPGVK